MFRIAIEILMGDKTKYIGLLLGIAFTAFLVTFALSYFAGFMTRGFSLVNENPTADVWVMDSAVNSTEATINMPNSALDLVKSVSGVSYATPLYIGDVTARFPNGHFQTFQLIGVDDATLSGAPALGLKQNSLHLPESVIVDSGGTNNKLQTPIHQKDMWSYDGSHLSVPTRRVKYGDELRIDDRRVIITGVSHMLGRFPPRPIMYTTASNFTRLTPSQNKHITFVMVRAQKGVNPIILAKNIHRQTGYKAITGDEFKKETVLWYLINSEDVGDMINMVVLAMLVGFGVTGVMLYMFTYENLKQYAVIKAMGATNRQLNTMVFTQAFIGASIGGGIGIGIAGLVGEMVATAMLPFRMMWFAPTIGLLAIFIVSFTAAVISVRPVLKLEPGVVFARR